MERKRELTVGVTWNSGTVFFVMWSLYCAIVSGYYLYEDSFDCKYFSVYLLMRLVAIPPLGLIAWLWAIGWWPRTLPQPEWVGVMFLSYVRRLH